MNILDYARRLLESGKYSTLSEGNDSVIFEDYSLFGFLWVAPSPADILRKWQQKQDNFLRGRDSQLRKAGEKSWNAYSIFLSEMDATAVEMNELRAVEEDFRGTRKVVKVGVQTESKIIQALLPLVANQSLIQLSEDDAIARLRGRLNSLPAEVLDAFIGGSNPAGIANIVLKYNENK